jgi:ABC-2 type transport system permease protein
MIHSLRRNVNIYRAIGATEAKAGLAYNWWVWADFVLSIFSMVIFVYFWNAVYADTTTLGGLTLNDTINYILIARILSPLVESRLIFFFGFMIRTGQVAVELTRPVDMQGRVAMEGYARLGVSMIQRIPLFLIAVLFLGLELPTDPAQWVAFAVTLLLGGLVLFMFDWLFACLAFYVTETWGLSVVRVALGSFFSGALVPLAMMPLWLQKIAAILPFAQALSVPVSFLSGITPVSEAPRALVIQFIWLIVLTIASRWFFNIAIRKVTVQGG